MPRAIPPELKPITAYIRRSEELDADKSDPNNRVIAYYCRSYAMEKAMEIRSAGVGGIDDFLMTLMKDLEVEKGSISMPREEAQVLCESHAVSLFHKADDGDRGSSDNYREIARTFYNATSFFDILEQFGPLDEEVSSKRTYSKWKATDIMKALKEGRTPMSGGYGGDNAPNDTTQHVPTNDMLGMSLGGGGGDIPPSYNSTSQTFDMPPAPTGMSLQSLPTVPGFQIPPQPQYGMQQQQFQPPPQQQFQPPPQQQFQPPQQTQHQPSYQQPASHQPSPNYVPPPKTNPQGNIADALELCAFAMAALKHNDTKLGRERLRDALNLLS